MFRGLCLARGKRRREFSAAAQQLSSLKDELASLDSVDMGKVDEIRQAISSGSYKIDTQKIAESLLALEGELAPK